MYDPILKGPNYPRILSSNPHFASLTQEDAETLLHSVPTLIDTTLDIGFVPEDYYDHMYLESPNVDNCTPKTTGMALNSMCVSRQRACVFTNSTFKEMRKMAHEEALDIANNKRWNRERNLALKEIEDRRMAEAKSLNPGRTKKHRCCNAVCLHQAETTNKHAAFATWTSCSNQKCTLVFCPDEVCQRMCLEHSARCGHK